MSKITESMKSAGRPVAYYPRVARALGGAKEGILVCQLFYLDGSQWDEEGWIYKTAEEILLETGLSYKEQTSAREYLKKIGVLEERYERLNHRMFFRVNQDRLNVVFAEWEQREAKRLADNEEKKKRKIAQVVDLQPYAQRSVPEMTPEPSRTYQQAVPELTNGQFGNLPTGSSFIRTKTTTKNTTENKEKESACAPPPSSPPKNTRQSLAPEAEHAAQQIAANIEAIPSAKQIPPHTMRTWAGDIEKLHRLDGKSWEEIHEVLTWTLANEFWAKNILSGKKFREKWNTLIVQKSQKRNGTKGAEYSEKRMSNFDILQELREERLRENGDIERDSRCVDITDYQFPGMGKEPDHGREEESLSAVRAVAK